MFFVFLHRNVTEAGHFLLISLHPVFAQCKALQNKALVSSTNNKIIFFPLSSKTWLLNCLHEIFKGNIIEELHQYDHLVENLTNSI